MLTWKDTNKQQRKMKTFIYDIQQVIHQRQNKYNYMCNLTNARKRLNYNQNNKPVENWDITKCCLEINVWKRGHYIKLLKYLHDIVIPHH